MSTILVTGATGRQGGSTARLLLAKDFKVHALVRNPDSEAAQAVKALGAVSFKGDAGDARSISQALHGVTGVFFNPPYPGPEMLEQCRTFINTCAEYKDTITTFVISTATGTELHAQRAKQDPNYVMSGYFSARAEVEDIAKQAGFKNLVILRPSFLLHNYLSPTADTLFPELKNQKLITALKPETKVPHMRAEDIGPFATGAFTDPKKFAGKEIDLAAENLTATEVAQTISAVAGVGIKVPFAQFEDGKAVGIESPVAPYHEWSNGIDASVDISTLSKEYGIEMIKMAKALEMEKEKLRQALGL